MSSTNRGYNRHQSDYYVTPVNEINKFLEMWRKFEQKEGSPIGDRPESSRWLDPCAGGDTFHPMSYPEALQQASQPSVLHTMGIRDDSLAATEMDYLQTPTEGYDVIITNPPFYAAQPIIEKALSEVNEGGYVVMLLRLNFLGSQQRFQFWQHNPPKYIFVHHKRMSFTENGSTDSIEYAHFVWQKGTFHCPYLWVI